MPCTDVTEILFLTLDRDDRVKDYALVKDTCGGAVAGRGLIRGLVKGRTIDEILTLQPSDIEDREQPVDEPREYLQLRHLMAVQKALGNYRGQEDRGDSDGFEMLQVEHGPDETRLMGRLRIDIVPEQIKACGRCDNP